MPKLSEKRVYLTVTQTEAWNVFKKDMENKIQIIKNQLTMTKDIDSLRLLQGQAQALEGLLRGIEFVLQYKE